METIKCLINFLEHGAVERDIIVSYDDFKKDLAAELAGALPFVAEFKTTKNELIGSDQVICEIDK